MTNFDFEIVGRADAESVVRMRLPKPKMLYCYVATIHQVFSLLQAQFTNLLIPKIDYQSAEWAAIDGSHLQSPVRLVFICGVFTTREDGPRN